MVQVGKIEAGHTITVVSMQGSLVLSVNSLSVFFRNVLTVQNYGNKVVVSTIIVIRQVTVVTGYRISVLY